MKKTLICLLFLPLFTWSQDFKDVDFDEFTEATQINLSGSGKLSLNWWLPVEFWQITFAQDPSLTDRQRKEFIDILRPYFMLAIVDGDVGPMGGVKYVEEEDIRKNLEVINGAGDRLKPLKESEMGADMAVMVSMFKPILASMMGEMGNNLHFYVFSDEGKKGKRFVNPLEIGNLKVSYLDQMVIHKTPVSPLLPKKKCPVDGEMLNGGWNYCPIHGNELESKE